MTAIICFMSGSGKITVIDAVAVKIAPAKLVYSLMYFFCQIIPSPEISFCFLHI
jgi:hypothetical protein